MHMTLNEFILRQMGDYNDQSSAYKYILAHALEQINVYRNITQRMTAVFCGNVLSIMKMRADENLNDIYVVSYLDLKDNADETMTQIRKYCKIEPPKMDSVANINLVASSAQQDSQSNCVISKARLRSYNCALTDTELSTIDGVLQLCRLPSCEQFPVESSKFMEMLDTLIQTQTLVDSANRTKKSRRMFDSTECYA